jgi:hypothetical protein
MSDTEKTKPDKPLRRFLVAVHMSDFEVNEYNGYDVIEATTRGRAKAIYDVKHNCSYFHGEVIGEVIDGHVQIPLSHFHLK